MSVCVGGEGGGDATVSPNDSWGRGGSIKMSCVIFCSFLTKFQHKNIEKDMCTL